MKDNDLINLRQLWINGLADVKFKASCHTKKQLIDMAMTPASPTGDILPLRNFNMLFQPSPSVSPTSLSSPRPVPDVASALTQYQNEILGGPPVSLVWKNLKVVASNSQVVLDNVSGFAEPFCLVAILGPPKSGKTTLLEALAGRLSRHATVEGELLLNGLRQQLTYGTAAYLTSIDNIAETLTVHENLYLSAILKLPPTMARTHKMDLVDQVIVDMGLRDCAYSQVGHWFSKGISQGERSRLSLAMELMMRPRLLYLDEPTSGLDSSAALLYMTKVRLLVQEGRTVVACFREPNLDIFQLLDYLLILGNGKTVYFGETYSAAEYFMRSGLHSQNPVGYYLKIRNADYEAAVRSMKLLQDLEKVDGLGGEFPKNIEKTLLVVYQNSDICARMEARLRDISSKKGAVLVNVASHAGFAMQTVILTYRSFLSMARNLHHYWTRLILSSTMMLMIGTIFINLGHSLSSIQERASCIFLIYEILMFISVGGMPFCCHELKIITRERLNAHYSVSAFVLGDSLSSLPFLFLISLVSSCLVYFLVGLHPGSSHFFYFVLNLFISLATTEGLMMVIATVASSYYAGMIIGSCVQIVFMLVAGYACRPSDIPGPLWTYPMSYISFHRYAIWGLYQNEFLGLNFGHASNKISGQHVIYGIYHMRYPGKWKNILILFCMAVFYRLLFYICIKANEQLSAVLNCQKWRLRFRLLCTLSLLLPGNDGTK